MNLQPCSLRLLYPVKQSIHTSDGRLITIKLHSDSDTYDDDVNGTGNKTSTLLASVQNGADTLSYTYDKNGNIETISKNGVLQVKYYYDKLNQVWREDNEVLQKTIYYGYDVGGNITGKYTWDLFYADGPSSAPLTTVLYEYNDASWKDKLTAYNGQEITYDEIGNPLTYGDQEFYWEGRQLQATSGTWGWSYYQYNDSGIRTQKGINGNLTFYHLNGDKVVREEGGPYGALDYFYDDAGNLFSFRMNGAEYFYIRNGQNDIIGILDSTGTQVVSYSYDTWGNILSVTGSMADTVGQANPYRYRGYRYDSETGLYYLQSRYYNPQWGRFINADVELTGDLIDMNVFAYCGNNPVCRIDTSGQAWYHWALGGLVVAGCAIAVVVTAGGALPAVAAVGAVLSGSGAATVATTVAASAFVGAATVYGAAAFSAAATSNTISDFNNKGNWGTVTDTAVGAVVGGASGYSPNKSKTSKLEKYIKEPEKNVQPIKIQKIAMNEKLQIGTLSKGSHMGQGLKVTWGGDRLLQYHPGGGHHGPDSYWKISSGETGTIRIFNN